MLRCFRALTRHLPLLNPQGPGRMTLPPDAEVSLAVVKPSAVAAGLAGASSSL